jgi:hypothetical protein
MPQGPGGRGMRGCVLHLFVEFCRNWKDSHVHNRGSTETLFEKEERKQIIKKVTWRTQRSKRIVKGESGWGEK